MFRKINYDTKCVKTNCINDAYIGPNGRCFYCFDHLRCETTHNNNPCIGCMNISRTSAHNINIKYIEIK